MLKRLVRDESGVALGLAIIMVVLIGVMGAGLLVFVNTDLKNVIENNNGQRAFQLADAGIQLAKTQQLSDVVRRHYDRDITNDCDNGQIRATGEDWSPITTVYSDPRNCNSSTTTRAQGGVTRKFNGGTFNVTIECYDQKGETPGSICKNNTTGLAPEDIEASKRAYFKITSTGCYPAPDPATPNVCPGAKRKVEAIYYTSKLDVPTAYYTPKNIEFNGNPTVSGVSFFAGGNIILGNMIKPPNPSVDRSPNALYQDWDTTNPAYFTPTSKLNTVPRRTGPNAADPTLRGAGFGSEGLICEKESQCSTAGDSIADGKYDYDSTTATKGSQKKFVRKSPSDIANNVANTSGTITYPFNPNAKFDLETLKRIAKSQGNYYEGSVTIDSQYPNPSSDQTVFYVNAKGGDVTYKTNNTPVAKGLIVVENGNFDLSNSSNGFDGVIIVTGTSAGNALDCNATGATGCYKNSGNKSVKGFVIAENTMTIGGTVDPFSVVGGYTQRPGFYKMKLWSWRELYQ